MKDLDRSIERVLSGLRNAEAPAEMERRVLAALQARASTPPTTVWDRLLPGWLGAHARAVMISAACGVAAVLVAVLVAPAIRRQGRVPAPAARTIVPAAPSPLAMTNDVTDAPVPVSRPIVRRAVAHRANKAEVVKTSDDLAEIEMRAPSMPAPPMPLTDQEELLLRLVHARDPVELAALDHKVWAEQFAKGKAQFDRFFAPPKAAPTGEAQ
ncbi:hypothetical protein GCM10011507_33070 [Edaphobacter acidisoli]|uniref:Uncharacterized protein n=1 Tax=Edaphobacter acidisoli TaxID=2040573 RepID=A0A916S1C9_9BACT|nr:hypothetical protein [Edaphobacter acidisoli]GGA79219.1 hypothetical protein GCM10011507_33070 [Edaphobacter acidisoli]